MKETLYLNHCETGTHNGLTIYAELNGEVENLFDTLESIAYTDGCLILENQAGKQISFGFTVYYYPEGDYEYVWDESGWLDEHGAIVDEPEYYDFVGYPKDNWYADNALFDAFTAVINKALREVSPKVFDFLGLNND